MVKGLISEVISRLEVRESADANHKGHCDKELSENSDMEEAKLTELEKSCASIDTKTSKSAQLERDVRKVADISWRAHCLPRCNDEVRAEKNDSCVTYKRNLENGKEGIRSAEYS